MSGCQISLSIVIPVFNEAESVGPLYLELRDVLDGLGGENEILFVDDGSRDATWERLESLTREDGRVRALRLRRNYGQTPAMQAGFDHARGRIVITMDGDLQNDPADIPELIERVEAGEDVVCGWRRARKDLFLSRRVPSWLANRLIGLITGVRIHDYGCTLRAYRAQYIRQVRLYRELHRFLPAILTMAGARCGEMVVRHRSRRFGQSKYGLSRTGKVLLDLLVVRMFSGFVTRPARGFFVTSLPFFLLASLTGLAALIDLGRTGGSGHVSVVLPATTVLLSFAFVHLLLLGVLAELVLRLGGVRESQLVVVEELSSGVRS